MKFDVANSEFDERVLQADQPVLVDFWAEWCMPCKMIDPILEEIASEYEGSLHVGRVNVDVEDALAAEYNIVSIPALLLFKNGEVVGEHVGAVPKATLIDFVAPHL